jgi:hypothetical protein
MSNKYKGRCHACGCVVKSYEGKLEKIGRHWVVRCVACYDKADNSSYEDRQCGDRAYEDRCAEMCGY